MKNVIIVLLVLLSGYLTDRVVREENQRYALLLGMCVHEGPVPLPDFECLDEVQTRMNWMWHLFYAVTAPLPAVEWASIGGN